MPKDLQGLFPILMSGMLILGICIFSILKFRQWNGPPLAAGLLMAAGYVAWLVRETRISLRDKKAGRTEQDKGSLEWYALSQGGVILSALGFSSLWSGMDIRIIFGPLLFVAGVFFRQWAVRELGSFYSHRVRIQGEHRIIQSGPYRFVRHPAYSGMILAHVGVVMFFGNLPGLFFLVLLIASIVSRIGVEEAALSPLDGYVDFCEGKKRLIPFVW
ncbi:MAG: hypothetical protein JEZ02_11430 [Desulfatibacillum sp.]|nr:hypothetical protein [Desulfatibacillum sp.]